MAGSSLGSALALFLALLATDGLACDIDALATACGLSAEEATAFDGALRGAADKGTFTAAAAGDVADADLSVVLTAMCTAGSTCPREVDNYGTSCEIADYTSARDGGWYLPDTQCVALGIEFQGGGGNAPAGGPTGDAPAGGPTGDAPAGGPPTDDAASGDGFNCTSLLSDAEAACPAAVTSAVEADHEAAYLTEAVLVPACADEACLDAIANLTACLMGPPTAGGGPMGPQDPCAAPGSTGGPGGGDTGGPPDTGGTPGGGTGGPGGGTGGPSGGTGGGRGVPPDFTSVPASGNCDTDANPCMTPDGLWCAPLNELNCCGPPGVCESEPEPDCRRRQLLQTAGEAGMLPPQVFVDALGYSEDMRFTCAILSCATTSASATSAAADCPADVSNPTQILLEPSSDSGGCDPLAAKVCEADACRAAYEGMYECVAGEVEGMTWLDTATRAGFAALVAPAVLAGECVACAPATPAPTRPPTDAPTSGPTPVPAPPTGSLDYVALVRGLPAGFDSGAAQWANFEIGIAFATKVLAVTKDDVTVTGATPVSGDSFSVAFTVNVPAGVTIAEVQTNLEDTAYVAYELGNTLTSGVTIEEMAEGGSGGPSPSSPDPTETSAAPSVVAARALGPALLGALALLLSLK